MDDEAPQFSFLPWQEGNTPIESGYLIGHSHPELFPGPRDQLVVLEFRRIPLTKATQALFGSSSPQTIATLAWKQIVDKKRRNGNVFQASGN